MYSHSVAADKNKSFKIGLNGALKRSVFRASATAATMHWARWRENTFPAQRVADGPSTSTRKYRWKSTGPNGISYSKFEFSASRLMSEPITLIFRTLKYILIEKLLRSKIRARTGAPWSGTSVL